MTPIPPILLLYAWARVTAEKVTRRPHTDDRNDDAGMFTMEVLIWVTVIGTVVGLIAWRVYDWLTAKGDKATQQ
jgi:hypothetical protein